MAKTYIENETKEQRKARKALEKLAKLDQELGLDDIPYNANPLVKDQNYVLCIKHGTKYGPEYVNKLYKKVKRFCSVDYTFVCLTDDKKDLDSNILALPLPKDLSGWWCKPYMFSNDLPLKGTILYLDLDVIICKDIASLFTYERGHWCTIRDFTRAMRPDWKKYNSSVIRFKTGQLDFVWEEFKKNPTDIIRKFFGDQDYLYHITSKIKPAMLYPDSWIQSWKWEIRKDKSLGPGSRGNRTFKNIEQVVPPKECLITVFHGDPNPDKCLDPWVVDNWQ